MNLGADDENLDVNENDNGDYYSSLKIPLSKYKMLNADGQAKNTEYMKLRKERDFSPITPSRAAVVRPGMSKDPNVLMSPKVVASLPHITSPAGKSLVAQKSTFSKKKDNSSFGSSF